MRHTTADRDKVGDRHSVPDACLRPRSADDPGDPQRRTLVNPLATVESLLSSSLAPTFYIIISPVLLASAIVLFGRQCRVCFSVIYRSVAVCLPGVYWVRAAAPASILLLVHHTSTLCNNCILRASLCAHSRLSFVHCQAKLHNKPDLLGLPTW